MVNKNKINKDFVARFITKDVGLEEYTMHDHLLAVNEILWEFYAHLELSIEVSPPFSKVCGQVVRFARQHILVALPLKGTTG